MSRLSLLLMLLCTSLAQAAQVVGVRTWGSDDSTRLVLELDGATEFRVSEDSTPGQLVLLLPQGATSIETPRWPAQVGFIDRVLVEGDRRQLKLFIALNRDVEPKVFLLGPNGSYGHRLVVDLKPREPAVATPRPVTPPPPAAAAKPAPKPAAVAESPSRGLLGGLFGGNQRGRKMVVTIDAGHGGEDPGAIGKNGTQEKMVTLAIARAVVDYLNRQDGIQAHLTRDADFFIPLQKRRQIGRYEHKADIFVSVHADSAPNRSARGASVFALSLKGAGTATSRFAQMLAEQENRSDLIGGVAVERDDVGNMLANLLVEGTLKHSLEMGGIILRKLSPTVSRLHNHRVEQAGFAVLKEPGMVSLLVETGFISNPDEEASLSDPAYQQEVARAIGEGIVTFCQQYPVPGTWFSRD